VLGVSFGSATKQPQRILCLGAHCDDIEIGCGGLLLQLGEYLEDTEVKACILSSNPVREIESRTALEELLSNYKQYSISIKKFRNGYFPSVIAEIKDFFETLKTFKPDLIITHYKYDHHQDHRIVSELTNNTFRDHLVLEYEILKYDGDLGNPNFYVPLNEALVERKLDILMKHFPSQIEKQWFSKDAFLSLLRIRGVHSASSTGFAEAYYVRKLSLAN